MAERLSLVAQTEAAGAAVLKVMEKSGGQFIYNPAVSCLLSLSLECI